MLTRPVALLLTVLMLSACAAPSAATEATPPLPTCTDAARCAPTCTDAAGCAPTAIPAPTTCTNAAGCAPTCIDAARCAPTAIPAATACADPAGCVSTADFAPPLSAAEAQARVASAQQAANARRTTIAQTLGLTSAADLPQVQTIRVPETGHNLSDRAGFLSFWRRNGAVLIFGYPVTDELIEAGRVVQYFERARFEYHPEAAAGEQVQLSLVGSDLFAQRGFAAASPDSGEVFYPETGHTLSGRFRMFWEKRGGLAIFGYPISEPQDEDGQTVQYFERAKFLYVPDELGGYYRNQVANTGLRLMALYEVQLADIGRQVAQQRGLISGDGPQLAGVPELSKDLWLRRIEVNLSEQWLTAYEGDTPVFRAPVATGKDGFNTPTGEFAIYTKLPMQTMVGNAQGETWTVPNIPWVQYVVGGVALHGTYWHDAWGTGVRMSHGCVNLNIDDAQWLYEWADVGTPVTIHY